MSLTLVILAAGRGSRFGGDKPLAEVGPAGQSLFEYSVYDAHKAGFKHIVFVVSADCDVSEYKNRLASYLDELKIEFVVQNLKKSVPENISNPAIHSRNKPWGTGHAVLVCRQSIKNPFVVINADDYYGRSNFTHIADYLLQNRSDPKACTLPGYRLENTLSHSGGVNRGICSVDSDSYLSSIHEIKNIYLDKHLSLHADESNIHINLNSIVSMTFWGFHPSFFNLLESTFQTFLNETNDLANDEFVITEPVNQATRSGKIRARVIPTSEIWKGVTYAEDTDEVRKFIAELTEAGRYPELRAN